MFELCLRVLSSFYLLIWWPFVAKYPNLIRPILKTSYFSQYARISFQESNFVIARLKHDTEGNMYLCFLFCIPKLLWKASLQLVTNTFFTASLCDYLIHIQKHVYGEFCSLLTINASPGLSFLLFKGNKVLVFSEYIIHWLPSIHHRQLLSFFLQPLNKKPNCFPGRKLIYTERFMIF